jgi:hypothetical protein
MSEPKKNNTINDGSGAARYKKMEKGILYWLFNASALKKFLVVFHCLIFFLTIVDAIYGLVNTFRAIVTLDVSLLSGNLFLMFIRVLVPIFFWITSTASEWFTYTKRRTAAFLTVILHAVEVICEYVLRVVMFVVTTFVLFIPVTTHVSTGIIVYISYYFIGVTYLLISVFFYRTVLKNTFDSLTKKKLDAFHFDDLFSDLYVKKKYQYSLEYIRYLDTGKKYVIGMNDRYLHTLVTGSTGTGKTSSCALVALAHDFLIKAQNVDIQKEIVQGWVEKGNVRISQAFNDEDFNLCYIEGAGNKAKQYDKKLEKLGSKIPNAGMTIMCPNSQFAQEVYDLAVSAGHKVNRIDPTYGPDGGSVKGAIGMNPLYVDPALLDIDQELYFENVIKTAELFADVNQAVYDESDRTDPYFASVNTNMAVNAAVVMIIATPLKEHRVATISDVLRVLNSFELIRPYREVIISRFGADLPGIPGRKETAPLRTNVGDTLQQYIDSIDVDFLGTNAADMNKQCTGLRNIIKSSIALPRIKKLLTAQDTIDFDKILSRGEITIVNFDLALGHNVATSFGLFFMLNFINAVMRRDRSTRIPHFFYIDETQVLLHPRMQECATYFRQFKVSCMFFIQSLSQFDKSSSTQYLRSTFLGNMAHQLIFGRASLEEMRYYSELAGEKKYVEVEESTRESTITLADPSLQTSKSNKITEESLVTKSDIRDRRFLECYVYSVRRSMPLKPFIGKVNFLDEKSRGHAKRYRVEWDKYCDAATIFKDAPEEINFSDSFTKTSSTTIGSIGDGANEDSSSDPVPQSTVNVEAEEVETSEVAHTLSSSDGLMASAETDDASDTYTEVY